MWKAILLPLLALALAIEQIEVNFDDEMIDMPSEHFDYIPNTAHEERHWKIVKDGEGNVLQRKVDEDVSRVSLAIASDIEISDLVVQVRIKCAGNDRDENGGLVWRYRDAKNYLLARLDVKDDRLRLYRIVNGNRIKFGEEDDLQLDDDRWYTLKIEHRGEKIKAYIDGDAVIVERDKHFKSAGQVGLYVNENSETYFDDFKVH